MKIVNCKKAGRWVHCHIKERVARDRWAAARRRALLERL